MLSRLRLLYLGTSRLIARGIRRARVAVSAVCDFINWSRIAVLNFDLCAGNQIHLPIDDDGLAGLEPLLNYGIPINGPGWHNGALFNSIIRLDHVHIRTLLG